MSRVRYSVQIAKSCFRTWLNGPRMLILMGMVACLTIMYAMPFAENARVQGEVLHVTEVFTAVMNGRFTLLLFSTAILRMFGNIPIIDEFTGNALIKGTRKCWIAGQMLYIVCAALVFTAFIFLISVAVCLPNVKFDGEWSRPVRLLATSRRIAISPERMKLPFPDALVDMYSPWQAFGHGFGLFVLMGCFYGMASLALRMKCKSAGFIMLLAINTLSWAMGMFTLDMDAYAILAVISPHYHTSLNMHTGTVVNAMLPGLGASYAILAGMAVLLAILSLVIVRKYDYVQAEVEHV